MQKLIPDEVTCSHHVHIKVHKTSQGRYVEKYFALWKSSDVVITGILEYLFIYTEAAKAQGKHACTLRTHVTLMLAHI